MYSNASTLQTGIESEANVDLNIMMQSQRRLTATERQKQAEHFLSFKNQRSFKFVESFRAFYSLRNEIGTGAFGSVQLGMHRKSKVPCAIKIIRKSSLQVAKVYKELNKNEF